MPPEPGVRVCPCGTGKGCPARPRLRAPQLSRVFLKHIPFNCVQGGQDHLAAGQGRHHAQNYALVLNPVLTLVRVATSGDVFQVGRCAGIQWAKMPIRIPLKSYSAQNSLTAKSHLHLKVNNGRAEKPDLVRWMGF